MGNHTMSFHLCLDGATAARQCSAFSVTLWFKCLCDASVFSVILMHPPQNPGFPFSLRRRHPRPTVSMANGAGRFWFGFGGESPASRADLSARRAKARCRRSRTPFILERANPPQDGDAKPWASSHWADAVHDCERRRTARGCQAAEGMDIRRRARPSPGDAPQRFVRRLSFGSSRCVSPRDASCRDLSSPFLRSGLRSRVHSC